MAGESGIILLVDDDKNILQFVSGILTKEGYEVLVCESGYAAYTLLENRFQGLGDPKVHVVISDWVMQGWDGMKLLAEIRTRPYRMIPFILMSGAVTKDQLIEAARNRADAVLIKPIDRDNLLAKVAELMARAKM